MQSALVGESEDEEEQQEIEEDEENYPEKQAEDVEEEEGEKAGLISVKNVPPSSLAWIDSIYHPDNVPWSTFGHYLSRHFFPSLCYGIFQGLGFFMAARLFRSIYLSPSIRFR